jgi:4-diphosphocytidyl-2-C-methyl-D-erythritol kinase
MSEAMRHDPRRVTVRAPAKINLHLGVGAPRPDGYHPLATVYQAVGLYDDVTVSTWDEWSVQVRYEGLLADPSATGRPADRGVEHTVPLGEDNIAVRAGRALLAHHGIVDIAAAITIHKSIPVAGGMAGGSADAAATLVALDRLWDLDTPDDDLLALAAGLGSDVPFALLGGTAAGTGRGELVEPVADAGSWWWVVVGNDGGLATPEVYRAFDEMNDLDTVPEPELPAELLDALAGGDVHALAEQLANDLQDPALMLRPDLQQTFDDGYAAGALECLLSGSGPSVLLLCADADHARTVTAAMHEAGHGRAVAVPAPVSGVHVVSYDGPVG